MHQPDYVLNQEILNAIKFMYTYSNVIPKIGMPVVQPHVKLSFDFFSQLSACLLLYIVKDHPTIHWIVERLNY